MAKPTASFVYTSNGLSVTFTDGSSGVVTSWLWDFGDNQTSTSQNPIHTYTASGIYTVKLAATNTDGTDIFQFKLIVSATPTLSLTIFEMVQSDIPAGIAIENQVFTNSTQKWMLYLQQAAKLSDTDVFDESKWTPLYRVLISKLIIYDQILKAAEGAMMVFANATQTYNQLAAKIIGGSTMIADYICQLAVGFTYPVTVNSLIINGVNFGPSGSLADVNAFINYLNSLNHGTFIYDNATTSIKSLANANILTVFNYTSAGGGVNSSFTQSNSRIVNVTQALASSISSTTTTGGKGPLKRLEAGPSVAEWHDPSVFWAAMFKATTSGKGLNGSGSGGVIGEIQTDICIYANRLGVQMPMCQQIKTQSPILIIRSC